MPFMKFREALKDGNQQDTVWVQWISDICRRFTDAVPSRGYISPPPDADMFRMVQTSKETFWELLYKDTTWPGTQYILDSSHIELHSPLMTERLVNHTGIVLDLSAHPIGFARLSSIVSKIAAPLGFNMAQLRLVDDFSFAYHSASGPSLFYAKQQKAKIDYPTTYSLNVLSRTAGKYGISIMPEVAISTNAGGWFHSNFNVECGEFLCEHGRYIPQDVNNPKYIPLVYSLIRELLEFTSSPYIHLGHDERERSLPCFYEAGIRRKPKFDEFEESLGRLLEFVGVTSARVVRWQNEENIHYPGRIGHITQIHANSDVDALAANNSSLIEKNQWFGTVDIRQGGPWQIYAKTRAMAAKAPIGIMAQIGDMSSFEMERNMIEHRLVAFSMGTMDKPTMSSFEFLEAYPKVCQSYFDFQSREGLSNKTKLSKSQALCKVFAADPHDAPSVLEDDDKWRSVVNSTCLQRTQKVTRIVFKNATSIPTALSMNA